jgi:translocation and assembly module TamB
LTANATLAGKRPFVLKAQAALKSSEFRLPFAVDLEGSGSLDRLNLYGKAVVDSSKVDVPSKTRESAAGEAVEKHAKSPAKPSVKSSSESAKPSLTGEFRALLTPFAARPLASLHAQLNGFDPSAVIVGAPQAQLDVDAVLESRTAAPTGSAATGHLQITNRRSGTIDRDRLPLEALRAQLNWQDNRLDFTQLTLLVSGGGSLKGQGSFSKGKLNLDLVADRVDAHALHSNLRPSRLAGPLHAELSGDRQALDLDLRDKSYALSAKINRTAELVELTNIQLAAGAARLVGQGRLALTGNKSFTALGSLQRFDPGQFVQSMGAGRSLINASFDLKGALDPTLDLVMRFNLADSAINKQKLLGRGYLDLSGKHLRKADIDLEVAGNRLNAQGSFGKAGDKLQLNVLAPKLDAIGWPGLNGDINGHLILSGTVADPTFVADLQLARLHFGDLLELSGLSFNAELGAGARGVLAGTLRCIACALPAYDIPAMAIEMDAKGLRSQHHVTARMALPERRELRLALDGGLTVNNIKATNATTATGGSSSMLWNGTLQEMRFGRIDPGSTVGNTALLHLAAPTSLRLSNQDISLGPTNIDGLIGNLRIEYLRHEQGTWRSAGRLQHFRPQTVVTEFPALNRQFNELGITSPQPLELAGDWDFSLGNKSTGRAALWRDSGDLKIGSVLLGLSQARLQTTLNDGLVAMSLQLSGTKLGEMSGEVSAASPASASGNGASNGASNAASTPNSATFDQAALRGNLNLSVPDLSWLGPLFGKGWQTAGKLRGNLLLGGTVAHPQFNGELRGDELALRVLDQGARFERGQALIDMTPDRLLLRRLSFDSEFIALPRVLALDQNIDKTRLTGTPGRIEASGELALAGGGDARLSVRMDRVGVMQRPDQWIAVSGEGELRLGTQVLDIGGTMRVDAGFWSLGEPGKPSLSDDVVIRAPSTQRGDKQKTTSEMTSTTTNRLARVVHLDLKTDLGKSFHFRGAGVESRLAGQVRIRSDDAYLVRASGTIRTEEGRFDAYGQKLEIERGIVNFLGPIDDPGLNVLAVRKNLPVDVGVEVTGTAQHPVIRLVSTPAMPDTEKLSWLVLGRSPEQQGGGDSGLLFAAAQSMFGGQDEGVVHRLQQGLGIDEFAMGRGELDGSGRLPSSSVASATGFGSSQTMSGQIVSVGKRISSNAMLSYEKALNTTDSVVKLTVNLKQNFSVVGSAGSESALDFFWHHSFGGSHEAINEATKQGESSAK